MTAAQKKARDNFKKAALYRKRTGCTLKEAFAHVKKESVTGLDKVVKKGNKTSVLYTKKTTKKAKPKTVKQGKLFGVNKYNALNFYRGIRIEVDKKGYGLYEITGYYKKGIKKAYTNDSRIYDWYNDDRDKKEHQNAKKKAFSILSKI